MRIGAMRAIGLTTGVYVLGLLGVHASAQNQPQQNERRQVVPEKELPRMLISTGSNIVEVRPADVHAVIGLFDELRKGEGEHPVAFVERSGLTLADFEVVLADIIYAVIDKDLEQAVEYFAGNKKDEYTAEGTQIVIRRTELPKMRKEMQDVLKKTYQSRGGMPQFRKNQKVILKFEKTIKRKVLPLLGAQRVAQPKGQNVPGKPRRITPTGPTGR